MKDLRKILADMPKEKQRWFLGNPGKKALESFDCKRYIFEGVKTRNITDKEEQQKLWQEKMQQKFKGRLRTVYIHIPFCEKKCSYCGFFLNASHEKMLEKYTKLLIEEIKITAQYERAQTGTINAVYFGGGTPSTLATKDIERLVKTVYEELPLARDCEVTYESRIHDMTDEKIEAMLKGGVNRFSLGVQSFDTKVRKSVGRIDPKEVVVDRLRRMVEYDGAAVTIDLMFGLPYQTMETWLNDIETQLEIGIHGGDIYQLNVYPTSDLAKHIEKGQVPSCMSCNNQGKLYVKTLEYIKLMHPEVHFFDPSHWAVSRRERNLYNYISKQKVDMLCFGSSAGGRLDDVGIRQHRNLKDYINDVENGYKPIGKMSDDCGRGKIFATIRHQLENLYLDGNYFKENWGLDIIEYLEPVIESWVAKELVICNGENLRFTPIGMFWHDNLIQATLEAVRLGAKDSYIHIKRADADSKNVRINNFLKKELSSIIIDEKLGFKKNKINR